MSERLPPGQRERADFPRFGLPEFAKQWPTIPAQPLISVVGDVATPCEIPLSDVLALPRRRQRSDFHCVTTWSRLGLAWEGVRFRDFFELLVRDRARPFPGATHLLVRGLDGFCADLLLEDAWADDVLLADRLDGDPLGVDHGAPVRLVAPARYGYKSVRHVCEVGCYEKRRPGSGGWKVHPRACVAAEERGLHLPGWFYRHLYRPLVAVMVRRYAKTVERARARAGRG